MSPPVTHEVHTGTTKSLYTNQNAVTNSDFTYEKIESISNWLLDRVTLRPKIGIICGSGLGGLGDRLQNSQTIPYSNIPNFPKSTVAGHKGNLIFGLLNDVPLSVCKVDFIHTKDILFHYAPCQ
jgi:purine-nucleoside phosphorylase